MNIHFKAITFMSLMNGGHAQVFECVEDPKIIISKVKKNRHAKWETTITYDGVEYESIEEVKKLIAPETQTNMTLEEK